MTQYAIFWIFFLLLEPRGQADINIQKQMAREDRLLIEFMAADENGFCASQVVICWRATVTFIHSPLKKKTSQNKQNKAYQ